MSSSIKLLNLKEYLSRKNTFSSDELLYAALINYIKVNINTYKEDHVYNINDKIIRVTDSGTIVILNCLYNGVTNVFDMTKWEEWNIMEYLTNLENRYIIVSKNEPTTQKRNKLWFKVK